MPGANDIVLTLNSSTTSLDSKLKSKFEQVMTKPTGYDAICPKRATIVTAASVAIASEPSASNPSLALNGGVTLTGHLSIDTWLNSVIYEATT